MVRKKCAKRKKEEMDRLSQLPAPVVAQILSFLPLKDAAATSVLSTRWRRRWLHAHVLDVDALQVFEHPGMTRADQCRQIPKHVTWISHVLQSHRKATPSELKKLRIRMRLSDYDQEQLQEWISYASECKVQNLELDFLDNSSQPTHECLDLCSLSGTFVAETDLSSLRSLSLAGVNVTKEVISSLLTKCPLLESLKVCRSDVLRRLTVCNTSPALKHLEVSYCFNAVLTVQDTSLVSLTVTWMAMLMLSNNPKLVVVRAADWIYTCPPFQSLYDCLSGLEVLTFDTCFPDKFKNVDDLPLLKKMKQLTLLVDPLHEDSRIRMTSLLSRAPNLEKLGLEFMYMHKKWKPTKKVGVNNSPRFPPVKVLEMRGYYGELQHAKAPPRKIIFDLHNLGRDMYAQTTFEHLVAPRVLERSERKRIKLLKRVVPSSAEFTVT